MGGGWWRSKKGIQTVVEMKTKSRKDEKSWVIFVRPRNKSKGLPSCVSRVRITRI